MKALIVCYSRTGNTRGIVNEISDALGVEVEELRCDRYTGRMLDWFRAIYDTRTGRLPDIAPLRRNPADYDIVAVAGPVWASHAAAPVRTFLNRYRSSLGRVAFALTLGGSGGELALAEMEAILGHPPVATLLLTRAEIAAGQDRRKLYGFATKLQQPA